MGKIKGDYMGITFAGNTYTLNLQKLLPNAKDHKDVYNVAMCESISAQIRNVMSMDKREVFLYKLPEEIQEALVENGFQVTRTSNKELEEYKVTWEE